MTRDRFSIITDGLPNQLPDIDREETREWLESLDAAIDSDGRQRARFLLLRDSRRPGQRHRRRHAGKCEPSHRPSSCRHIRPAQ